MIWRISESDKKESIVYKALRVLMFQHSGLQTNEDEMQKNLVCRRCNYAIGLWLPKLLNFIFTGIAELHNFTDVHTLQTALLRWTSRCTRTIHNVKALQGAMHSRTCTDCTQTKNSTYLSCSILQHNACNAEQLVRTMLLTEVFYRHYTTVATIDQYHYFISNSTKPVHS